MGEERGERLADEVGVVVEDEVPVLQRSGLVEDSETPYELPVLAQSPGV